VGGENVKLGPTAPPAVADIVARAHESARPQGEAHENTSSAARRGPGMGSASLPFKGVDKMLWYLVVALLVLWVLGYATAYTVGGFLHLLLLVALVLAVLQLVQGRRTV
jgi:hypothetical protein